MNLKEAPVFFIGMPRSGTTIIFNSFSKVESFGWISQYQNKMPSSWLPSLLNRLTDNNLVYKQGERGTLFGRRTTLTPVPSEAYKFYARYLHAEFANQFLLGEYVSGAVAKTLQNKISGLLDAQGKTRYVQKFTGPGKVALLRSAFPTAKFVHVIRWPPEVAASLLKVNFWRERGGDRDLWWRGAYTERERTLASDARLSPTALVLLQWARVVDTTERELAQINKENVARVHYASFVGDPLGTIKQLFADLSIEPDNRVWTELASSEIKRRSEIPPLTIDTGDNETDAYVREVSNEWAKPVSA